MNIESDLKYHTPTIKDVARAADVSLKTVSRVINESINVSAETRQKVLETIKKVGYRPNAIAKSLRVKKTFSIGVIIADITNSFHSILVRGIEDVALSKNYRVFCLLIPMKCYKKRKCIQKYLWKKLRTSVSGAI